MMRGVNNIYFILYITVYTAESRYSKNNWACFFLLLKVRTGKNLNGATNQLNEKNQSWIYRKCVALVKFGEENTTLQMMTRIIKMFPKLHSDNLLE